MNATQNIQSTPSSFSNELRVVTNGSRTLTNDEKVQDRYQREEDFHASLKRAASLRRRLADGKAATILGERDPEAAIARALYSAAKTFSDPQSASRNDAFFDAAIESATKTTLSRIQHDSRDPQKSILDGSEDWSLSEMMGIFVTRSTETIVRQQDEIQCLRLVVRELMGEMLRKDNPPNATNAAEHVTTPRKGQNWGEENIKSRSLVTPSTGNSTMISSDSSEKTTPTRNTSYGPPYSSHAPRRHELAKELRISRSSSGDSQDSQATPKLKDVQRTLDHQMQDAERTRDTTVLSQDTPGYSSLMDWQERHTDQLSISGPEGTKEAACAVPTTQRNDVAPSDEKLRTMDIEAASRDNDGAEVHYSSSAGNSNSMQGMMKRSVVVEKATQDSSVPSGDARVEKTHVGLLVESILDAIIDRSLDKTGEESMSSLMFPGLQSQQSDDVDQNSILNPSGNVGTACTGEKQTALSTPLQPNNDTIQTVEGAIHSVPNSSTAISKSTIPHLSDPPAQYMQMESKTVEDDARNTFEAGNEQPRRNDQLHDVRVDEGSLERTDPTGVLVEEQHFGDRDTAVTSRRDVPEEDSDYDDDEGNARRMVVLISSSLMNRGLEADQERAIVILHANGIEAEFVDGADPDTKEVRESLFGVSGLQGIYPQFFLVEDDGMTEFFGDFQEIEQLNDAGELRSTFSRLSTTRTPMAEAENEAHEGTQYQEEKKDEQFVPTMPDEKEPSTDGNLPNSSDTSNSHVISDRSWRTGYDVEGNLLAPRRADGHSAQSGGESHVFADSNTDTTPRLYTREENFPPTDPSRILNGRDSLGRLPVINEDHSGFGPNDTDRSSSYVEGESGVTVEPYGDGSRDLQWV